MTEVVQRFEAIVRRAHRFTEEQSDPIGGVHPFDERDFHPSIPRSVRELFDNGHYSQATFEAFKFVDKEVQRHSEIDESGFKLMMRAFSDSSPAIRLTSLANQSKRDEQEGYRFIFAGSILAIRNPRGHEVALTESPDQCLDHLSLVSLLLRRLEQSGFKCTLSCT